MTHKEVTAAGCACAAASDEVETHADRRALILGTVATGVCLAMPSVARAAPPARPQAGDHFVYMAGDRKGQEVAPGELVEGEQQILAWPMDPQTKAVRDSSRLALVLLVRLDPANLDEPTRSHAADGIVGYAATCSHAQCPVNGWNAEKKTFRCQCHNSEYDPRQGAKVVFGPAPRPLPPLPLKIEDGVLVSGGTFIGRVGTSPT